MNIEEKILSILVKNNVLSEEQANRVKHSAIASNTPIVDVLYQKKLVANNDILKAKAESYNVPFIPLIGRGISPDVLSFIPEPVARKYKVIPFELDKKENKLHVAMADPLDLPLVEFLQKKSGKKIIQYLADEKEILSRVEDEYSAGLAVEVSAALEETGKIGLEKIAEGKIGQIIKEAPITKIVSVILEYAIRSRASDIHIEPQEKHTRVRYRIDGILHEKLVLPKKVHEAIISRIKILSGMKIDERRIPQDGRFNFKIANEEVDLRVSTLPAVHGEKVVLRLLKKTGGIPDLSQLGLSGPSLNSLLFAISRPHGIILVSGPTGSGKTTTLYSVLSRLNTNKVNIMTLEDPVEYEIVGLNQVQINPAAGLTFASGLRSFLRQDPNIILVGEIRDSETTTLAIQAALTGHLVFSTLHTNNAATAIPRLLDLGAEPFLIVSVLNAVEAQRIARRVCTSCKEAYLPLNEVIEDIKNVLGKLYPIGDQIHLYRGKGCKECNNSGYLGRIGIFETILVSQAMSKLILERASAATIEKQAIAEGMITMKQDGYLKALAGITSLEEVLRVAEE